MLKQMIPSPQVIVGFYLLVDAIVLTENIVTTNDTSNKWMNTCFLTAIDLLLHNHQRFVDGSKYTQILCMLLGCSKDAFYFALQSVVCITLVSFLFMFIMGLTIQF